MKHFPHISGIRLRAMISTIVAGITLSTACTSDMSEPSTPYEPGQPAHIRLSWSLPEMNPATRTLTEEDERTVNNLWIGIYDYTSGKLKSQQFIEPKDDTPGHHVLQPTDILDVKTVSGQSRIVAVANADTNYGFSDDTSLCPVKGKIVRLDELLAKADTWQKYLSICVARTDATSVDLISRDMVMSGIYYGTMDHPADMDWTAADGGVYIPAGDTELDGALHLRRIDAKVRFEIVAGAGVEIEMTSWQVINNPIFCNLHEQRFNAGDRTTYFIDNRDDTDSNYSESRLSQIFENSDGGGYEFTFYQYENKRRGLEKTALADGDWYGVESYADREREYKNATGGNSGVYKSLCATADAPDTGAGVNLDNYASLVEIKAKVSYNADDKGNVVTEGGNPRIGYATYTVHLGYCEDKDDAAERARDFNCRRNTSYNYKITINSLTNIVVEAEKSGENQSGAEGDVTDAIAKVLYLDSHYGVFNIHLTDDERRVLNWRINAPYDDQPQWLSHEDYELTGETPELRENPFYNWVRFKPTSDENTLAVYMEPGQSDSDLWTLEDMRDVDNRKSSPTGWYTVFIDEYSYLLDSKGNRLSEDQWQESDWMKYVNQQERIVWIDLRKVQVSDDEESSYSYSKYMIAQYSMQSYYDNDRSSGTALAVEHFNESWGKNLDWQWSYGNTSLNNRNGRWNMWQYISNGHNKWDDIVDQTAPDPYYPVPLLRKLTGRTDGYGNNRYNFNRDNNGYSYVATESTNSHNPQSSDDFYEIISACMSRNRDINGNGIIDANEMKWYLPAEGKYERTMLGRNALSSPLFDVNNAPYYTTPKDPYAAAAAVWDGIIISGNSNQVHYASSDKMKFFPEEGGSYFIEELGTHWPTPGARGNGRWPWNIRCMRNLGSDLSRVTAQDPVTKAYEYIPDDPTNPQNGGVFDLSLYYNRCLRGPISTFLPVHSLTELSRNLCAQKFRLSKESISHRVPYGSTQVEQLNMNLPCGEYYEEADASDKGYWRAPNQRELMMIINEQLHTGSWTYSCTMESYGSQSRFSMSALNNGKWYMGMEFPVNAGQTFYVRCVRDIIDTRQE